MSIKKSLHVKGKVKSLALTLFFLLNEPFDVIFLDPFIESNNASLVTLEFFRNLKKLLKPDGILVASTALHVSQIGLTLAGFDVHIANDTTSDIKGIVATLSPSNGLHVKGKVKSLAPSILFPKFR